jgi:hypothetical protein
MLLFFGWMRLYRCKLTPPKRRFWKEEHIRLGSIKLFARWVYKNTNARDDIVDDAMCRGFMGCYDSFVTTLTIPKEDF